MKRLWNWLCDFYDHVASFFEKEEPRELSDEEREFAYPEECPNCGADYLWAPVHDKCYSCGRNID